jgi:hypothetical protein
VVASLGASGWTPTLVESQPFARPAKPNPSEVGRRDAAHLHSEASEHSRPNRFNLHCVMKVGWTGLGSNLSCNSPLATLSQPCSERREQGQFIVHSAM